MNNLNGLIKLSKLERVNFIASLVIAFSSIAAAFYVMATAFTGGGVA